MTIDQLAIVSALVGALAGAIIGMAHGIKNEARKARAHYTRLINSAMENAYNAGFTDAMTKGKKRPSGNGGR
jgi:hypothetical protein